MKKFATFEEAVAELKDDQVIKYGDSIIKMSSGIVVTKPVGKTTVTSIYKNDKLLDTQNEGGVSAYTELEYVDSTDKYIKIKAAGRIGYINTTEHSY